LYDVNQTLEQWNPSLEGGNINISSSTGRTDDICTKTNSTTLTGVPTVGVFNHGDFKIFNVVLGSWNNNSASCGIISNDFDYTAGISFVNNAQDYIMYRNNGVIVVGLGGPNLVVDTYDEGDVILFTTNTDGSVLIFKNDTFIASVPLTTGIDYTFACYDVQGQNSNFELTIIPQDFPVGGEIYRQVTLTAMCDCISSNTLSAPTDSGIDSIFFNISLSPDDHHVTALDEEHELTEPFLSTRVLTLNFTEQAGTLQGYVTGGLVNQGILTISLDFKEYANII